MTPAEPIDADGDLRDQVRALVAALGEHTETIAPLVTIAPALGEMAAAYTASKSGVTWLGQAGMRVARGLGIVASWAVRVGGGAAMAWELAHARWAVILGAPKP